MKFRNRTMAHILYPFFLFVSYFICKPYKDKIVTLLEINIVASKLNKNAILMALRLVHVLSTLNVRICMEILNPWAQLFKINDVVS